MKVEDTLPPPAPKPLIYVQPHPKRRIEELLMNPPLCLLTTNFQSVKWLDEIRREFNQLK